MARPKDKQTTCAISSAVAMVPGKARLATGCLLAQAVQQVHCQDVRNTVLQSSPSCSLGPRCCKAACLVSPNCALVGMQSPTTSSQLHLAGTRSASSLGWAPACVRWLSRRTTLQAALIIVQPATTCSACFSPHIIVTVNNVPSLCRREHGHHLPSCSPHTTHHDPCCQPAVILSTSACPAHVLDACPSHPHPLPPVELQYTIPSYRLLSCSRVILHASRRTSLALPLVSASICRAQGGGGRSRCCKLVGPGGVGWWWWWCH